jgi:hypothetical protein
MRALATCILLALPAQAEEVDLMALKMPSEITLRPEVSLPAVETVRHKGRKYTVRFAPEGGSGYTRGSDGSVGQFWTDLFLVGGAGSKMEAVAVYLRYCHGERRVDPVWGDEYVPTVKGTGEYAFQYPDDCPAWRKSRG